MVSFVRPPIPSDFCEGEVAALRAAEPRLPRPGEMKGKEEGGGQVWEEKSKYNICKLPMI